MFDKAIVDTDSFMDLPMSAKALYFLLGMEADDEGFVSYKKVIRIHGGNNDDIKVLITKKFLISFQSGVVVITDWQKNNYLDKNRLKKTEYVEEKQQLTTVNGKYLINTGVKHPLNKCLTSIEESRVEESRREENSIEENISITKVMEAEPNVHLDVVKEEYGRPDINKLLEDFKTIMGYDSASSKDRIFAKHLLNNYTQEQLTSMLKYCSEDAYAPRVGSLEKLWFKRGDVIAGLKAKFNKQPTNLDNLK